MENDNKKYTKIAERFSSVLLYTIVINFVILVIVDGGDDKTGFRTPYPFFLGLSLLLGYILSHIFSYFKIKSKIIK